VRTILRAPNHYGAPKSPNNVTSTFFNKVNLLPKDLRFKHGGAKLASCPGCHLNSLRPCRAYERGYDYETSIVPRPGKVKVGMISFSVIKPKIISVRQLPA